MPEITGTTRTHTGVSLSGVTVKAYLTSDDTLVATTTSDTNGFYNINTPAFGPYYLVAYKDGEPDLSGTTVNTLLAVSDVTPNTFTFASQNNVSLSWPVTSNTITLTGMEIAANISVLGGWYSKNGLGYTSIPSTANVGDTISLRFVSSSQYGTTSSMDFIIGTTTVTWSATTMHDGAAIARQFVLTDGFLVTTTNDFEREAALLGGYVNF